VGDLAIFGDDHIGIVAKVEPNKDHWIIGGNQGDYVSLQRYPYDKLMAYPNIRFRKPVKREQSQPSGQAPMIPTNRAPSRGTWFAH